jgi:preprotein translocase subunit SecA
MNTFVSFGKVAHFYNDTLVVDGETVGEFKGLKEAKEFLEGIEMSAAIAADIQFDRSQRQLTEEQVAIALYESGEKRVTESLVAGYKALIETKRFFPHEVVLQLRERNEMFPSKVDYVMKDGSTVLLDIETNMLLNTIVDIKESSDLLRYMTKDANTFIKCVQDLLEDN